MVSKAVSLSQERAQQKQLERERDARDLASGEKTRKQLRAERGAFAFPSVRLRFDLVKSFVLRGVPRLLTYGDTQRLLVRLRGMQLVLVGGQAVNFWAEQFHPQEPTLLQYALFCSQDIDFLGDRDQVKRCAELLRCRYNLEDPFAPGPSAGVVVFEDEDQIAHPIDFLRTLYGLDADKVLKTSIQVDVLDEQEQVATSSLRVMNPIWCLIGRVHNVVGLPATYDNEHGLWQLRASILCAKVFLSLLLSDGRVREALECIECIYELCHYHPHGRALYRDKKIDPFAAVVTDPRLPAKFNEVRYPQLRRWLAARRGEP